MTAPEGALEMDGMPVPPRFPAARPAEWEPDVAPSEGDARPKRGIAWSVLPLALVLLTLVGSVLVPARQTVRILDLLRSETDVIEPARHHAARLEFRLTTATLALQGYARSGDATLLPAYDQALAGGEERLRELDSLARRLGPAAAAQVTVLSRRVHDWRATNAALLVRDADPVHRAASIGAQQASYAAALDEATQFASYLEREAASREALVREAERRGLIVNASLVLIALVTMGAVAALSRRERYLTGVLRRRVLHERLLRETGEALGAAITTDDVRREALRMAMRLGRARGACIERPSSPNDASVLTVVASLGDDVPPVGATVPMEGSAYELATRRGEPATIAAGGATRTGATTDRWGPRVAIPLGVAPAHEGALLLALASGTRLEHEDAERLRTFSQLVAMAFERAGLLESARTARERLERVMASRARLMRGFSHDVKNPIGAAGGHAALLADEVYGPLNADQMRGVTRIRHALDEALSLIDDLHELTRSDTGHLVIVMAAVDAAEVVAGCGDDFRAAAATAGLDFAVELPAGPLPVVTDAARMGQVVSNLLSNAIKYTQRGRVVLRARMEGGEKAADGASPWLLVEVSDTGQGIPEEQQEEIFEEFARFAPHQAPGAGLGLAISRRVASALGGALTVRSVVGQGSTFTLRLPAAPAPPA